MAFWLQLGGATLEKRPGGCSPLNAHLWEKKGPDRAVGRDISLGVGVGQCVYEYCYSLDLFGQNDIIGDSISIPLTGLG